MHEFMAIVSEYYTDDWHAIIPRDNATPHILLLRLFDKYDDDLRNAVKAQTPFHKLSYKNLKYENNNNSTFYNQIIRNK